MILLRFFPLHIISQRFHFRRIFISILETLHHLLCDVEQETAITGVAMAK